MSDVYEVIVEFRIHGIRPLLAHPYYASGRKSRCTCACFSRIPSESLVSWLEFKYSFLFLYLGEVSTNEVVFIRQWITQHRFTLIPSLSFLRFPSYFFSFPYLIIQRQEADKNLNRLVSPSCHSTIEKQIKGVAA